METAAVRAVEVHRPLAAGGGGARRFLRAARAPPPRTPPDARLLADARRRPARSRAATRGLRAAWRRPRRGLLGHGRGGRGRGIRDALRRRGQGRRSRSTPASTPARSAVDHPRVRIRDDLAALGLARPRTGAEPEDHFAGLFDVMRVLVAGGAGARARPARRSRSVSSRRTWSPACGEFLAAVRERAGVELLSQGRRARRGLHRHRERVVPSGLNRSSCDEQEA